jgi:predicted aspartyl protease
MTYATVDFDDGIPYVGRRPKGSVAIHGPGGPYGTSRTFLALVDTGADYMHLPLEAIQGVGLARPRRRVRMMTAGGRITMWRGEFDVDIQGVPVRVPVNVAPNARPLIGRQAIYAVLDNAGFSTTEWLLDLKQTSSTQAAPTAASGQPSPASTPTQPSADLRIVDHGSWVQIGSVRVNKRQIADAARATQYAPDDETWKGLFGGVVI